MDEVPAGSRELAHEGLLPLALAAWAVGRERSVFVAANDSMLLTLTAAMPFFLPGHRVLPLPAWDNVPYDLARPSRTATGTRVTTLAWLAEHPDRRTLLLTTPEALTQRIPPAARLTERAVRLRSGQVIDLDWLKATLEAFGYETVDQVDEPGEAAVRAAVVDLWPAGAAAPVRLDLADGRVGTMRRFDPDDQRTIADVDAVRLLPTSEGFTVPGEDIDAAEQILPDGPLSTLFDLLPDAAVAMMEAADQRIEDWLALVADSYRVALTSAREGELPPPDRLYLGADEVTAALAARAPVLFRLRGDPDQPAQSLAAAARQAAAAREAGKAVIVCGDAPPRRLREMLARRLHVDASELVPLETWQDNVEPGQIGVASLPLRHGFQRDDRVVLAVHINRQSQTDKLEALTADLAIGDLVVEPERGVAQLTGLVTETQAGAAFECLALAFRGGSRLLIPALEAGRVWRYGAAGTLKTDRLDVTAWAERRARTEREIAATAASLVAQTRKRQAAAAPVIEPADAYRRFTRRVPFAATADQIRAIVEVRRDLAAGHPMLRLVCGDVGFGKTEVALHAAALAAFAGHQVAVVAPTTLLARQHLNVFRRRLGGFGLRIGGLIRSSRSAESRAVLRGLASGDIDIVIGTHAVSGARFRDLALVVIDEEQRFGEARKRALREKRDGVHALIMTATPLPRTLQGGLLNLVDISVLAQPPAARLPVRSVVVPFDPVVVHAALSREARRGGQSFVVCPRIEDLEPMRARLREIVPRLTIVVAHGAMRGEALDRVVLEFSAGRGDVLLTTTIVEAGLDIPNANTMLIWRPDRFGLAQSHQLRGRVGRGRVRANAYFLTDPEHPPGAAAARRLSALAGSRHPGAGFALSVADLEQRGAGDLLGDDQAGHIRLIGTELYRDVLGRALARARGEVVADAWTPTIVMNVAAPVPADFVPEPSLRLEIYRRLARIATIEALDEMAEGLADRFGDPPAPVTALLDLTRLRLVCQALGIAALHVGPEALAITPREGADAPRRHFPDARDSGGRLIVPSRTQLSPGEVLELFGATDMKS